MSFGDLHVLSPEFCVSNIYLIFPSLSFLALPNNTIENNPSKVSLSSINLPIVLALYLFLPSISVPSSTCVKKNTIKSSLNLIGSLDILASVAPICVNFSKPF